MYETFKQDVGNMLERFGFLQNHELNGSQFLTTFHLSTEILYELLALCHEADGDQWLLRP